MPQASFAYPPRFAVWLVELFTPDDQAEAIPGDLVEEFSQHALKSGPAFARRWYWRQSLKTVAHLFGDGFRDVRWLLSVVGAGLLGLYGNGLWNEKVVVAILARYHVYGYVTPYSFWVFYDIVIGCLMIPMLTGCITAIAAKKRGMAAAIMLSLVFGALYGLLGLPFLFYWLSHWHNLYNSSHIAAKILISALVSPVMIAVGGRIGRKVRFTLAH
jgi:hypothetical protein